MTRSAEKPTVREAVAAALSEGDQGRAAALGSAQLPRNDEGLVLTKGDGDSLSVRERLQLVERDGKDLGLELAALLLRAKYANDYSGVRMAKFRFALRLRVRARKQVRSVLRYERLVIDVAGQSIAEWIADRCEKCKGTGIRGARMGGVEELLKPCPTCDAEGLIVYQAMGVKTDVKGKIVPAPKAQRFRATGLGQAMIAEGMDYITIQCPECRGMRYMVDRKRIYHRLGRTCRDCDDGEARPRYADRARALGISRETYDKWWHRWFVWAGGHLTALDRTLVRNLRCELGRGYSPEP